MVGCRYGAMSERGGLQVSDASGVSRDDFPLPDYDHLPLPALTHRIRSLDAPALEQLLGYEREHGNRLPVIQALQARLDGLAAGAEPSSGSASDVVPEQPGGATGGSRVSPATAGPAMNPPSHGDPTNPRQPR